LRRSAPLVLAMGRFVKSWARVVAFHGRMSGVMSPRVRERIGQVGGLLLAWALAGLFFITQDSVPRLYRGEFVPWKYVFVGWMTGMYICAALTPALLWLCNVCPLGRRVTSPRVTPSR